MKNLIAKGFVLKIASGAAAVILVAGVSVACFFKVSQNEDAQTATDVAMEVQQEVTEFADEEIVDAGDADTTIEEDFIPLDPGAAWNEGVEEVLEPQEKTSGLLENGNFKDGMTYWETYSYLENNIEYDADGDKGFEISIANTGTEDWHVQLKQNGIKLTNGKWYKITLDAKSSINRSIVFTMQKDGMADDIWTPYSPATELALSKNWKSYSIVFRMNEKTDPDVIMNFAMGTVAGTRITTQHTVGIRNIKMQTLSDNWMEGIGEEGNLIKNGNFEYKDLLWEPSVVAPGMAKYTFHDNKAEFDISNPGTVDWHVQLKQAGIPLEKGMGYRLTFLANSTAARTIKIGFMDKNYVNWYGGADAALNAGDNRITVEFRMEMENNNDVLLMLSMGKIEGVDTPTSVISLRDFKLEKVPGLVVATGGGNGGNGGAAGGNPFTSLGDGWMVYDHEDVHSTACYVDGINGYRIDINDNGTEDWHVQLQKKGVALTQEKWYRVTFDVKGSIDRTISYMLQKDGASDNDWTPYSITDGSDKVAVTEEWQTITQDFNMGAASDMNSIFNFSLGSVGGTRIVTPHTVWIRNIVLQEIEAPRPDKVALNTEMLKNPSFEDGSNWNANKTNGTEVSFADNKAVFTITNPGSNDYDIQLAQTGLSFEKGCKYRFTFRSSSDVPRDIKIAAMVNGTYEYINGMDIRLPGADGPVAVAETSEDATGGYVFEFVMNLESTTNGMIAISMGNMGEDTPQNSVITFSDMSLMKIAEQFGESDDPQEPQDTTSNLFVNPSYGIGGTAVATKEVTDSAVVFDIQNPGTESWMVQVKQSGLTFEKGCKYKLTFDVVSTESRSIKVGSMDSGYNNWYGGEEFAINAGEEIHKEIIFDISNFETDTTAYVAIELGNSEVASIVTIKNVILVRHDEAPAEEDENIIVVNATDEKVTDKHGSKWLVQFENADYDLDKYVGKKVKISVDLNSEGSYSGMMGLCYGESWDASGWTSTETIEATGKTTYELVTEQYLGALQIQLFYISEGAKVEIKNLKFEEIVEPENPATPELPVNLLANPTFDNNGTGWEVYLHKAENGGEVVADVAFAEGKAVYDITNSGTDLWHVQLKQTLALQGGCKYKFSFDVESDVARALKVGSMDMGNALWYGGADVNLAANESTHVEAELNLTDKVSDETAYISIQLGNSVASRVVISNVTLVKTQDNTASE